MSDAENETTMTKDGRPFVLAWVEKATLDKLNSGEVVFSEATDGLNLKGNGPWGEDFERTGNDPDTISADTTISF